MNQFENTEEAVSLSTSKSHFAGFQVFLFLVMVYLFENENNQVCVM